MDSAFAPKVYRGSPGPRHVSEGGNAKDKGPPDRYIAEWGSARIRCPLIQTPLCNGVTDFA